jgi:hypothetical protein
MRSRPPPPSPALPQSDKSFLVLFFKKAPLACFASKNPRQGLFEQCEVGLGGEAVVSGFDEGELDVVAYQALVKFQAELPGHVRVVHAVQDADRAGYGDGGV